MQKNVTFYVFCRVSYVFSNYGQSSTSAEKVKGQGHRTSKKNKKLASYLLTGGEWSADGLGAN